MLWAAPFALLCAQRQPAPPYGNNAMRVLLLLTALALGGCASLGGAGPGGVPSSEPSRVCTYEPSFSQPGRTDVQCF